MFRDRIIVILLAMTACVIAVCFGIMLAELAGYSTPVFVPAAVQTVLDVQSAAEDEAKLQREASSTPAEDEADLDRGQGNALVNINLADMEELMTLPGIGPVIAANIIGYRERTGGFSSVEQLIYVERIGEKTLDDLRPLVTVQE